jgi:hypothetical protein
MHFVAGPSIDNPATERLREHVEHRIHDGEEEPGAPYERRAARVRALSDGASELESAL